MRYQAAPHPGIFILPLIDEQVKVFFSSNQVLRGLVTSIAQVDRKFIKIMTFSRYLSSSNLLSINGFIFWNQLEKRMGQGRRLCFKWAYNTPRTAGNHDLHDIIPQQCVNSPYRACIWPGRTYQGLRREGLHM